MDTSNYDTIIDIWARIRHDQPIGPDLASQINIEVWNKLDHYAKDYVSINLTEATAIKDIDVLQAIYDRHLVMPMANKQFHVVKDD